MSTLTRDEIRSHVELVLRESGVIDEHTTVLEEDVLQVSKLDPWTQITAKEIVMDSVELVEFTVQIETDLAISIPDKEFYEVATVGDYITLVQKYLQTHPPAS